MSVIQKFLTETAYQHHPLRLLTDFLEQEKNNEIAKKYNDLRFVGYVLDINYDTVTIITSDPFKIAVGGVPRNSLLLMTPSLLEDNYIPHFTLLRVLDAAPTPLSRETQQTINYVSTNDFLGTRTAMFGKTRLMPKTRKLEAIRLELFYPKKSVSRLWV